MGARTASTGILLALAMLLPLMLRPHSSYGVAPMDYQETIIVQLADMPGAELAPAGSLSEEGFIRLLVPEGQDARSYADSLTGAPGILSAQADARVFAAEAPDDPFYGVSQASYLSALNVEAAWDLSTGGGTVVVAVIDSGTDVTHEDFAGRLWQNLRDANSNGIDDDGNGCVDDRYGCRFISDLTAARASECGYETTTPVGAILDDSGKAGSQDHSHGTLVAGVLGAAGDNGTGVTGVAWNIRIMTLKVLDCGTSTNGGKPGGQMSDVALAIDYARRMGADIINLSLASLPGDATADLDVLRSAIEAARAQGIIIVAAAGNEGAGGVGLPAAYTQYANVIGVGAADNTKSNVWATYSGVGDGVDFAAPGNNIASTLRSDLGITPAYGVAKRGTSFSTPLVTGMFALMKSRNSVLGYEDLIQFAREAATPASTTGQSRNWAGAGVINIGEAVARVPMTVNGDALEDWLYMEPGVLMRAFVGSTVCGTTTTGGIGPVTRFNIRVLSSAERTGCGEPGKTVRFLIGGDQAQTELAWGERNEDLARQNRNIVVVSPPPGSTVVQRGTNGWSLATHLPNDGPMPAAVSYLPGAWTEVHAWRGGAIGDSFDSYVAGLPQYVNSLNTIGRFDVYWVNGSQSVIATPKPTYAPGRLVFLEPGWNVFVFTGVSREVSDALAEVEGSYEQVMRYDNQTQTWQSYLPGQPRYAQDFGGLMELQIYWIYVPATGFFTIN